MVGKKREIKKFDFGKFVVEKFLFKLKKTSEVGKFLLKLESFCTVGKFWLKFLHFLISIELLIFN